MVALTPGAADAAVAGYVTNQAPLQPDALLRCHRVRPGPPAGSPPGSGYQLDGINGRMTEISHSPEHTKTGAGGSSPANTPEPGRRRT
jgi:hypothetical protein